MEHWPGHQRQETAKATNEPKDKGKEKEDHLEPTYWQWPHLEHGSIGRGTLVSTNGRVQWSSVANTSSATGLRWLPLGRAVKVFPETRSPQVNVHEYSASQRAEKGLQYLRTYFPEADLPGELLGNMLEVEATEMHRLEAFDPFLGNVLEVIPSHHTRNESTLVFPMGELGRELNMSRFGPDKSGNMILRPAGSPSFTFETPVLQISSAVQPAEWTPLSFSIVLIRTHTSSCLLRLDRSKVTREVDVSRSETGDISIVDSRILGSGPDIVAVNRNGKIYKCDSHRGGKAMQFIGTHEAGNNDHFWQLGITGRQDECFLASCKAIKHIDLRSGCAISDVFSLDHPSAIVASFESPTHNHISRITTTSDVIWLDDRFRKRPLLSFKHYRSFDRTLRALTANFSDISLSLLTSRRNGLVTLYDVGKGSDGLVHCNSAPSCLPHYGPMFTAYDGHALVALPEGAESAFLRLCHRGSIHRQDILIARPDEDRTESVQRSRVTHQWDEDTNVLEERVNKLQIDFGPAGGRHYTEVNLRAAYEKMFAFVDNTQEDMDQIVFKDMLARLPDVWQDTEEDSEGMLTTLDIISADKNGSKRTSQTGFFAGTDVGSEQVFDPLMTGCPLVPTLANRARWHYNLHDTLIPGLHHSVDYRVLNEYLKELDLVSGVDQRGLSVRREEAARKQLVVDLALSDDVYSPWPLSKPRSFAAGQETSNMHPTEIINSAEPPEVQFEYFHPVRKSGADHYAENGRDNRENPGISSSLGVRLLLAEWELGTNPNDYTYRDPYGVAELEPRPILQYRIPPAALPTRQKKEMQPPLVVATGTQPPVVQSQPVQWTHSQQSLAPGFEPSSQEPMMSTQVVPGRFGGRPEAGKKLVKKRIGGF